MTDELLALLTKAESASGLEKQCQACVAIRDAGTPERKDALERALAGSIGVTTLAAILKGQGINVGRRAIVRHRQEGHTS